jgi:rhamnosyl/mannosyltransferase
MKQVNATLLLVGDGPQAGPLRALGQQEGVAGKIRMIGRVDDLQPYFQAASLFVLPSITRAEAFGIVQLEAMAAGLPVINTNVNSGVPEVSVHGETGLTVAPEDVNGLAEAIQLLLENHELRCRFGEAARARVIREYTADLMAERTLALYQEVLAKPE